MTEIDLLDNIYKNKLLVDLFENDQGLKDFHCGSNVDFIDESFLKQRDLDSKTRNILYNAISKQYEECDLPLSKNIELIKNEGVFTITTGHQLCLFGGPQYFIHKIVSVICLAKKLKKKFPKNDFLPVFWLASEDHDFKEINHLNVFNNHLSVEGEDSIAVGKLKPSIFDPILQDLQLIFKNDNRYNELEAIFSNALKKATWSQSTRYWISKVFNNEDLIVFDSDDKSLKELFFDSFSSEINHQFIHNSVVQTNKELVQLGYEPKINPRELNLFYLSNDKRERIIIDGDNFKIGKGVFTKKELLGKLNSSIEKFSPNVLLRPLYQESILPNLIYVGGPSEIAYWLQLKKAFQFSTLNFPVIVLRDHFAWLNSKQMDKWLKMGFSNDDLIKKTDDLIKLFLQKYHNTNIDLNNQKNQLNQIEIDLVKKASDIDQTLVPMVKAALKGMKNTLDKVNYKFAQSLKKNEDQQISQIKTINNSIIENGVLKERVDNFIGPFLNCNGDYIERLKKHSSPEQNTLKVLIY